MIIRCEAGEFEISDKMEKVIKVLGKPYAAGILKKKKNPSLQEIMLGMVKLPKISLNEKQAQRFIYGKDIKFNKEIDKSGMVVVHFKNEPIGVGILNGTFLKNLADIGIYLRRE